MGTRVHATPKSRRAHDAADKTILASDADRGQSLITWDLASATFVI